jgi:hypothetical protein
MRRSQRMLWTWKDNRQEDVQELKSWSFETTQMDMMLDNPHKIGKFKTLLHHKIIKTGSLLMNIHKEITWFETK